jgi:biotin carboxyl carrier protein
MDDRTYVISVEADGKNRFRARLGNEVFEVEGLGVDDVSSWIVRRGVETERVRTRMLRNDRLEAYLVGLPFSTSILSVGPEGNTPYTHKAASGNIRALMSGKITNVLVKEGDSIQAGTPLLILKAMKMQNEIVSPFSGQVRSVRFKEGDTLKKDSTLMKIE